MPDPSQASVVAALSVHLEPLVNDARVLVVADPDGELADQIEELGARSIVVLDPTGPNDLRDLRDAAFDLAVVADVGMLEDPAATVARLARVVDGRGAVVAMAHARTDARPSSGVFPELAPASVGYSELYELFALRFEHVAMTGVVPFRGVVFAELGHEDSDVGVSVDTRLVDAPSPEVFVVVASREPCPLEPYAIVQIGGGEAPAPARAPRDSAVEAELAEVRLKADLLAAQLDEQRVRAAAAEARMSESAPRMERSSAERDAAIARVAELEAALVAKEQALDALDRRVRAAEQGMLDRDDRIAALDAELDAVRAEVPEPAEIAELVARAERAEAALALNVADLAHVADAHASEIASLEAQLRERAHVIAALERELMRREHIVRELVTSLEEAREGGSNGAHVEPAPQQRQDQDEERARLRKKLDELAMEVARREGELRAQAWRVTELENARSDARSDDGGARVAELERELGRARDELDALRQALRQEHALVEQLRAEHRTDAP